jgi:hypothetical protein
MLNNIKNNKHVFHLTRIGPVFVRLNQLQIDSAELRGTKKHGVGHTGVEILCVCVPPHSAQFKPRNFNEPEKNIMTQQNQVK